MGCRVIALLAALAALGPAAPARAGGLVDRLTPVLVSPGVDAPGVNRDCRPTAAHPLPVVLLHGFTGDRTITWQLMGPALAGAGYCVFAVDYGHRGTDPMERSAPTIARFVDQVLARTGAAKVAIVGYSEGGLIARYYLRFLGGAAKVAALVGISPPNHGTSSPVFPALAAAGCTVCREAIPGSAFLRRLDDGAETLPGVRYTTIATAHDDLVTPFTTAFLAGPAARVANVRLQDACPADPVDHFLVVGDPVAIRWTRAALDAGGRVDPTLGVGCAPWGA